MDINFSYDDEFCDLITTLKEKYGEKLFELDGIGKKQLDINAFSKKFYNNKTTAADVSVDSNSNITQSDIITYNVELPKAFFRLNAYFILWKKLKQLYGKDEADRIIERQLTGDFYINDFHGLQQAYCFNYSTYDIALLGLPMVSKIKSIPPKHLYSFKSQLEQFVVFASNSTLGACLYKDQELIIKKNNLIKTIKAKDLISKYSLDNKFIFNSQKWETSDTINNIQVWENGKFVELKRVFKRKYNNDIYKIKTRSGKECFVSEDHIFKVLFRGRELEIKAKDLRIYDTVFNTYHTKLPINKDSFEYQMGQFIGIINGDDYVGKKELISISINYKEKYIAEFLDKFLSTHFNMKGKLLNGNKCYQYNIYSTKFRNDIVNKYFGKNITGKNKYPFIDNESIDFKLGYIDGLLVTDDCYAKGHRLQLISKKSITNVVNILQSIGFNKLDIHEYIDSRTETRATSYIIHIPVKINDYLDLTLIRRKKVIKNSKQTKETFYTGLHAYHNASSNKITKNIVTIGNIKPKRKNLYKNLTTDVIVSIETTPNDDPHVYEIETDTHWYSAGGILTHNCGLADVFITMSYYVDKMIRTGADAKFKLTNEKDIWTYVKENIVSLTYTLNQPFRGGHQSAFTNVSIFDDNFLKELIPGYNFIDENGNQVTPKLETVKKTQEIFLNVMNEELSRTPVTFPVTTACISVDENNTPKDQNFIKMIAEKNKQFGFINIYCGKTSTLSSCCRLRSDTNSEYFNAFGAGSSKIGSLGVVTTNLPRLAIRSKTKENFMENLKELVTDVARINNAKRHIIKKRIEVGASPLYSLGFMSLKKQYSTFGITGLNEAVELLGYDILEQNGQQLVVDMLEVINKTNDKMQKQYEAPHNCEQTPAENSGIKLSKKDNYLKYTKDSLFYSNQFVPLIQEADMLDRIKLQGLFDSHFSGGSILHVNVEEQITDTQKIIDLINTCAKMGVVYWAINYNLQMCEADHMTIGANGKCPMCGEPIKENFTRVVGFLTNIKNWNVVRRERDYPNRQFYKEI